jgi:hypothetical protein
MKFDLSNITLAFTHAHDAAQSFDAMTADMVTWHESGIYPANADVIAALVATDRWSLATCKVYASNLIKWAKSGQTPRSISQVVKGHPDGHAKGKAGRKPGAGAGKTTKPADDADDALPEVSPLPKEWLRFIDGMRARVPALKTWTATDIAAFQDSSAALIALIKRNV